MNAGAAAMIVCERAVAEELGLAPMLVIRSAAVLEGRLGIISL